MAYNFGDKVLINKQVFIGNLKKDIRGIIVGKYIRQRILKADDVWYWVKILNKKKSKPIFIKEGDVFK